MFRGVSNITVDAKGRVAMPTRHRDRLLEICEGQLVVTVDVDHCLLIYPQEEWEQIEGKLVQLSSLNRKARSLQRLLVGHATEVELDGNGRMLLPQPLREFAGIERRAVLIGQGKKFELWDEERWNRNRERWLAEYDGDNLELSDELESLSL